MVAAMRTPTLAAVVGLLVLGAGCGSTSASEGDGGLPQGSEPVTLDPADFSTRIDNRYWPMAPGSRWVYREERGGGRFQRVTVTVTHQTKKVAAGVTARVVHDVVRRGGALVEDTYDWYAQDGDGNVWYLGEDTREYQDGKIATREGSWEAGVDGAQAGIIMPARPRVGMRYRQEYYAGKAEDRAEIVALRRRATVPYGRFDRLLVTRDSTPLEPSAVEHKYYAQGVGPVLSVSRRGHREELVRFRRAGS
jgi:hypothetical protein